VIADKNTIIIKVKEIIIENLFTSDIGC